MEGKTNRQRHIAKKVFSDLFCRLFGTFTRICEYKERMEEVRLNQFERENRYKIRKLCISERVPIFAILWSKRLMSFYARYPFILWTDIYKKFPVYKTIELNIYIYVDGQKGI